MLNALSILPKTIFENSLEKAPMAYALSRNNILYELNLYSQKYLAAEIGGTSYQLYENKQDREKIIEKFSKKDEVYGEIIRLRMKDNTTRRFNCNFYRISNEESQTFVMWAFDVEESERQKDSLKRAEADIQNILNNIPVPIVILEAETFEFMYTNKKFY